MANENKTVVTYDVSDAVKQLERLNFTIDVSADKADTAFNKMGEASEKFESALSSVGSSAGLSALGFNALVEAGQRVVNTIDTMVVSTAEASFGWETAANSAQDFIDKLESMQSFTDVFAGMGDVASSFRFEKALEDIRLRSAARNVTMAESSVERNELQVRLRNQQRYYAELDRIADQSAKRREKLEQHATRLAAELQDGLFEKYAKRFTPGAQVSKLLEEADRLSKAGEFGRAESMLKSAQEAATGNRVNEQRVTGGMRSLIADIQAAAKAAGEKEQADRAAAEAEKVNATAIQSRIDALQRLSVELALANKQDRERQRQLQLGAAAESRRQEQAQAARDAQTALGKLDELANKSRGSFELMRDIAFGSFNAARIPDNVLRSQLEEVQSIEALGRALQEDIGTDPTIAKLEARRESIERYNEAIQELQSDDQLAKVLKPDLERFQGQSKALLELLDAARRARAAGADRETVLTDERPSAVNLEQPIHAVAADTERAAAAAALLEKHFDAAAAAASRIQVPRFDQSLRPIPTVPPTPAQPAAQTIPARSEQKTITVTMNVTGGMIDQKTISQITAQVAREIRKGTAEK